MSELLYRNSCRAVWFNSWRHPTGQLLSNEYTNEWRINTSSLQSYVLRPCKYVNMKTCKHVIVEAEEYILLNGEWMNATEEQVCSMIYLNFSLMWFPGWFDPTTRMGQSFEAGTPSSNLPTSHGSDLMKPLTFIGHWETIEDQIKIS